MSSPETSESAKILQGSAWLVGLSWFNRLIGFCSVFILARLLTPEDFGVVAVVMIVLQLAEVLSSVGSEQYYIQHREANQDTLNTAWTLNLLLKTGVTLVLLLLTPWFVLWFDAPHLALAFYVMAVMPLLAASANGYIFEQKKGMEFGTFAKFSGLARLAGSLVAISLALITESYWAILIGMLLTACCHSLLSYGLLPQRAHFGIKGGWEQLHFSKWVMMTGLVGHARAKFDIWYASSLQGLSGLGGYNLAKDLVLLPSREFLGPITQVLFSSFARHDNHSDPQNEKIYLSLFVLLLLALPMAAGLPFIIEPFVALVLGQQWLPYVEIMQWLSPLLVSFAMGNFYSSVLTAQGKVKPLFWFDLSSFTVAVGLLLIAHVWIEGVADLAVLRALIGLLILFAGLSFLVWQAGLDGRRVMRILLGLCVCTLVMILALLGLNQLQTFSAGPVLTWSQGWDAVLSILANLITAALVYLLVFIVTYLRLARDTEEGRWLWYMTGRIQSKLQR